MNDAAEMIRESATAIFPEHGEKVIAEQKKPLLNNYAIKCLNGWEIMVASPLTLEIFWKLAKADECVTADKVIIAFNAIATIEFKGMFDPNGGNVTSIFGQARPIEQAQHIQPLKP